jgi:hypothetical protein
MKGTTIAGGLEGEKTSPPRGRSSVWSQSFERSAAWLPARDSRRVGDSMAAVPFRRRCGRAAMTLVAAGGTEGEAVEISAAVVSCKASTLTSRQRHPLSGEHGQNAGGQHGFRSLPP